MMCRSTRICIQTKLVDNMYYYSMQPGTWARLPIQPWLFSPSGSKVASNNKPPPILVAKIFRLWLAQLLLVACYLVVFFPRSV